MISSVQFEWEVKIHSILSLQQSSLAIKYWTYLSLVHLSKQLHDDFFAIDHSHYYSAHPISVYLKNSSCAFDSYRLVCQHDGKFCQLIEDYYLKDHSYFLEIFARDVLFPHGCQSVFPSPATAWQASLRSTSELHQPHLSA